MSRIPVENVSDEFELIRVGSIKKGDYWVNGEGAICLAMGDSDSNIVRPIFRKKEKPKQYRPFGSAEEFEPHRDKWMRRAEVDGVFRVDTYNSDGVYFGNTFRFYHELLSHEYQWDDGTPCGIELKPLIKRGEGLS